MDECSEKVFLDTLQTIQLETTSRCNLLCKTCLKPPYQSFWKEHDMCQDVFDTIIEQFPKKVHIHLQGWGEPLLHADILYHIQRLKEAAHPVSFTTNGTLLTLSLAVELIKTGLDAITFSMAGCSESTHDFLRGKGTFNLFVEGIGHFIKARKQQGDTGPQIAVSYLLTPQTIKELPKAVRWCRQKGVDLFATVHLSQVGCDQQKVLQLPLSRKLSVYNKLLRARTHFNGLGSRMRIDLKSFSPAVTAVCDKSPLSSLFISSRAEVSPCVFLCPPISVDVQMKGAENEHLLQKRCVWGNLTSESLRTVISSKEYQSFRQQLRQRQQYHDKELAKVSYSMTGPVELECGVAKIKDFFLTHPSPWQCKGCQKMSGY